MDRGLDFEEACLNMGRVLHGSSAITAMLQGEEGMLCALRLGHAGGIVVAHRERQGIVAATCPRSCRCYAINPWENQSASSTRVKWR